MRCLRLVVALSVAMAMPIVRADDVNPLLELAWQLGPTQGAIGDKATINIPEGFAFLGATDTKKFMEMNQNLASGNEYLLAPETLNWFAVFHFNPVGYVKDNDPLDAADLLESVKKGTQQGNEERRRRGWRTMSIVGWRFQPQYDSQAKLLEWAFEARNDSDNQAVINYNTRLLGRAGVMEVVLVSDPEALDASVASLKAALAGFQYVPGEKYTEFRKGDRVAEFGLAALIAGGAAAVAAKKGFFAVIAGFLAAAWKVVIAVAFGVLAWIGSLFKKKNQ